MSCDICASARVPARFLRRPGRHRQLYSRVWLSVYYTHNNPLEAIGLQRYYCPWRLRRMKLQTSCGSSSLLVVPCLTNVRVIVHPIKARSCEADSRKPSNIRGCIRTFFDSWNVLFRSAFALQLSYHLVNITTSTLLVYDKLELKSGIASLAIHWRLRWLHRTKECRWWPRSRIDQSWLPHRMKNQR